LVVLRTSEDEGPREQHVKEASASNPGRDRTQVGEFHDVTRDWSDDGKSLEGRGEDEDSYTACGHDHDHDHDHDPRIATAPSISTAFPVQMDDAAAPFGPNRSIFEVFSVASWRKQLPAWMLTAKSPRTSHLADEAKASTTGAALGSAADAHARLESLGGMARSSACIDMVMMSCFLGNDFLPIVPGLKLDKRGLEIIASAWRTGTAGGARPIVRIIRDIPLSGAGEDKGTAGRASGQPIFRFGFRCSLDITALSSLMRVIAAVVEPSVTGSILDGIEAAAGGGSDDDESGDEEVRGSADGGARGSGSDDDDGGFGELLGDSTMPGEDDEDDGGFADLLREDSAGSSRGPVSSKEPTAVCPVMPSGMEDYYSSFAWGLASGEWIDAWSAREAFERVVPSPLTVTAPSKISVVEAAANDVVSAVRSTPPTTAW